MRGAYEFDFERAKLDYLSRLDPVNQSIAEQIVLFELSFRQTDREMRGIDGDVEFFEDVRQRAQVILVSVRQDDGRDVVPVLFQKIEVRDTDINAVNALFRETHAGVNDDHFVIVAHSHTIHPKLADTAERDDL